MRMATVSSPAVTSSGTDADRGMTIVSGPGQKRAASALAAAGLSTLGRAAFAQTTTVELPIANGKRNVVAFPEKRPLIVLTTRPPQLETPFEVFNDGVITPNDAFFVRYHNAGIPISVDGDKHVIKVGGDYYQCLRGFWWKMPRAASMGQQTITSQVIVADRTPGLIASR